MSKQILVGHEVPTGKPVYLPFHHAGFTGMTGIAGKTTLQEGAGSRSGYRVIGFMTKRGERAFRTAKEIPLFFKERSDWQYIESLIEAEMREDQRYNRAWIIKICRNTHGKLREVWKNCKEAKEKARKDSLSERVYTCLDAYFELIIPELERFDFSKKLKFGKEPILYVMNLIGMNEATQAVIIRSVLEELFETEDHIIELLPEAWKFIGKTHTPVTAIAERVIKQGYSIDMFLWIDSQDIASINPVIRGQIDNWILGKQRYEHEIARTLKAIPVKQKPTVLQIQTLKLGHFYVACEDWCSLVYGLPVGVPQEVAIEVAKGLKTPEFVRDHYLKPKKEEMNDLIYKEKAEKLEKELGNTKNELEKVKRQFKDLRDARSLDQEDKVKSLAENLKKTRIELKNRGQQIADLKTNCDSLKKEAEKMADKLKLFKEFQTFMRRIVGTGEITTPAKGKRIALEHHRIAVDLEDKGLEEVKMATSNIEGKIIFCALKDLPKEGWKPADVKEKFAERGWSVKSSSLSAKLSLLCGDSLLVKLEGGRYRLPTLVKFDVSEAEKQ